MTQHHEPHPAWSQDEPTSEFDLQELQRRFDGQYERMGPPDTGHGAIDAMPFALVAGLAIWLVLWLLVDHLIFG